LEHPVSTRLPLAIFQC